MIQLYDNKGIPKGILLMMAVVGGLTVANLYYNQPLLEKMRMSLCISEVQANLITVMTQIGYALGLVFIVPMADIWSRRRIIMTNMSIAVVMATVIATAGRVEVVWVASVVLGACSVVPQIFVPMAGQFSRPDDKSKNMGIVLSGLLMGVLGARVISGYLGSWLGWRWMFGVAAVIMLLCLIVSLRVLPIAKPTYEGNYRGLMRTVIDIFRTHPQMRLYSLRAACSFGSMMAIWSCLAFHLTDAPFHAGSDTVGMLGLCGVAGAMAASVVGKYVPRFGIQRISVFGSCLQMAAWLTAFFLGDTYGGIIAAIMLVDIGSQCQQLSNQSGCIAEVPGASNRANTIFMTSLFTGGCMGTFAAGMVWGDYGWTGICAVGFAFCLCSMIVSAYIGKKM